MADIATVITPSGFLDWVMDGPDLATETGLQTALIISYFTDRQAEADDVIPDGTGDRRGWWGDLPLEGAATGDTEDHIGSRLWLLTRALATTDTANRAKEYCLEALSWMLADGVAQDVAVTAQWQGLRFLEIDTAISQLAANSTVTVSRFRALWDSQLNAMQSFTVLPS